MLKKAFIFLIVTVLGASLATAQDSLIGQRPPIKKRNLPPLPVVPQYPGGKDSLAAFLKRNTRYPAKAKAHHIKGTVEVQFIVKKDGSLENPHVYKSLSYSCDKEALRLVKLMPRWIPSMAGRDTIEIDYHVVIPFGEPDTK